MAAEAVSLRDPAELDVVLAPMRRRHLRSVVRIEQRVYGRPWTPGLFASELALRDQRTYLVAKIDGKVVGYGGVLYVLPDAHVTTLVVDPDWRRCHIATRVLIALSRAAVAKGASALTLEVRASNHAAQALYRRFGFVAAGIRRKYYPADFAQATGAGNQENAVIMWLHDIDEPAFGARLDDLAATIPGRTIVESS